MRQPAMETRSHICETRLPVSPETAFGLLITPSAVRGWWGAARAVILAQQAGVWAAAWGEAEDDPDYITAARIAVFDPPRRLTLDQFRYFSRSGALPFEADITAAFSVEPAPGGCVLRVEQDGFPIDAAADEYYRACEKGWSDTFENIRRYVASSNG